MKSDSNIIAIVPVREGSTRIADKNFLPFGEHATLIHRKVEHLKKSDCFSKIYISSDSLRAHTIALECDVDFVGRSTIMCSSEPRWDEVMVHILDTVPGNPHVLWAMVTSPLFERYREAVDLYFNQLSTHDSLVGVKSFKEYFIDEEGRPLFYSFGPWHPYSHELKPLYAINDTVFISRKSDQLKWRYWIGRKPVLFQCEFIESIDINFPEDLKLAQLAYETSHH